MNVIKKIVLFIKNILKKQDEPKKLEEPKIIVEEDKRDNFIQSLKVNNTKKRKRKKIETAICEGDGLGIQKKITW